jgi:hypothetical protein
MLGFVVFLCIYFSQLAKFASGVAHRKRSITHTRRTHSRALAQQAYEIDRMTADSKPASFDEVFKREMQEILKRRREANIPIAKDEAGNAKSPADSLVGLALSGGGVRSASFNLGLLQSLYQNGVLRHIDYMSTVSGGGYVGGGLSSLALHPETEFEWKSSHATDNAKPSSARAEQSPGVSDLGGRFPLTPSKDGRQPSRVLELIHGGHYLRHPLIFLNRYLIGVLLTNVVALSLVFAVASLAAWLFRSLDHTWMINWLYALGFQGDVGRVFFPATVCFFLWILMWGISYWRRGSQAEGLFARLFLTLTIVSFMLGSASLLGTGDVSLTHLRDNYGIEPPSDIVRTISGDLKTYFLIGLALALIPYLRVKDLIRSGTRPRTAVEGWIFAIASRALLYGIPLVIFGWLARENISFFNENRTKDQYGVRVNTQFDFVPLDFVDWSNTWQEIELQATGLAEAGDKNSFAVSRHVWGKVDKAKVHESIETLRKISAFDREVSLVGRWILFAGFAVTRQPNDVYNQFDQRQNYLQLRWDVCNQLTNELLTDPQFYKAFENLEQTLAIESPGLTQEELDQRIRSIKALISEARLIEKKIENESPKERTFVVWKEERKTALDKLSLAKTEGNSKEYNSLMSDFPYGRLEAETKSINWRLIKNYWGDRLTPKSTVYAMVVLEADQALRWSWFIWSLGLFLLSSCVVNMNATSLHGFYHNMLSKMWITETPGLGRKIPLARLETVARGAPYHLIGTTVHLIGRRGQTDRSPTDIFLFSQAYCGSSRTGYLPTENYMNGRFDLSNAIALSGAAVSPTQVQNPLLAVLLMLSNSRLGQWLPNPGHRVLLPAWLDRFLCWVPPVPLRLLIGTLQRAEQRNYCFISDGGHHENLGLESLLLRRCRVIIASDATCDPTYEFCEIVRLLRRMRFEFGIRISSLVSGKTGVPLEQITPRRIIEDPHDNDKSAVTRLSEANLATSHYFVARILYPSDGPEGTPLEGYLIFIKPNFSGDEAVDLVRYQVENSAFPHDPTSDQFYDPQKFESYRQLGFHIGRVLCDEQFQQLNQNAEHSVSLCRWVPELDRPTSDKPDHSPNRDPQSPSQAEDANGKVDRVTRTSSTARHPK